MEDKKTLKNAYELLLEANESHKKQYGELLEENKEQEEYIKYWQNEYDNKVEVIDKAIEIIDTEIDKDYIIDTLLKVEKILKGDSNES